MMLLSCDICYLFICYVARIDLAGAWTDTPPQAYEFGGLVSTLAIKISGKVSGEV